MTIMAGRYWTSAMPVTGQADEITGFIQPDATGTDE